MQLFNNKWVQTVLYGLGALLLFGMIFYSLFAHAFPKNAEEEQRIKQFQSTWDKRAQYYKEHPHKELSEQ
ncbi:hypothetical protein [Priestia megaterium]|uniref:hypothetical protein n=1 Tax=Priestia megaterium TaxID=1404 RepID=UPI00196A8113|nr:hypothetical protein [Priestia megaterium]QSF38464.1 hypothetical protein ICR96_23960 [Priestia megaterium]